MSTFKHLAIEDEFDLMELIKRGKSNLQLAPRIQTVSVTIKRLTFTLVQELLESSDLSPRHLNLSVILLAFNNYYETYLNKHPHSSILFEKVVI